MRDNEEKLNEVIWVALDQFRTNLKPDEALKQSQAVLNLMHAKVQWGCATSPSGVKRTKTD